MRIWPENRLEPEHRVSMKQQFTRSLSIFKVQKLVFSFSFEFELVLARSLCLFSFS